MDNETAQQVVKELSGINWSITLLSWAVFALVGAILGYMVGRKN
jgi:choline-glycine betaine transporter